MLLCEETLTLVHPVYTQGGESYACTVIEGASWHGQTAIALENGGVKAANTVKVRLPQAHFSGTVSVGDWLVRGAIAAVNTPDDFAGETFCRVLSAADNRGDYNPHWAVVGA